jgi:hypothetical protein
MFWTVFWSIVVIGGLFVVRGVAATVLFYYLLPAGDRCPNCDAPTLRVESKRWNQLMPWFRTSWCYECEWHGLLRHGELSDLGTRDSGLGIRRTAVGTDEARE